MFYRGKLRSKSLRKPSRSSLQGIAFSANSLKDQVQACGSHFFNRGTMQFFRSRLLEPVYPSGAGGGAATYFVTSEKFVDGRGNSAGRKYTVRKFENCEVRTVGDFQQFSSAETAKRYASQLARKGDAAALSGLFGARRAKKRSRR